MEILVVACVAAAALVPILKGRAWGPLLLLLAAAVAGMAAHPARPPDPLTQRRPIAVRDRGYVSSAACKACHPGHYASWHRTHHRTMTQVIEPETMLADWHGRELAFRGRTYRLTREGDEFWIAGPRGRERAVVSTGAHNQQIYWTTAGKGKGRTLHLFGAGWLVAERRWVPYEHTFLRPTRRTEATDVWNAGCIQCHATAGQPKKDPAGWVFDSTVAEFGIACEACHGPGREHMEQNHDPARRYRLHLSGDPDETIVHPGKLTARRSSQVCGQCHGISGHTRNDPWWTEGTPFRPGDDLHERLMMLPRPKDKSDPLFGNRTFDQSYWEDGMVRVSGREYMGLLESPCFAGKKFSCLSCHSMHASDPDDQLANGMDGDGSCLQCHRGEAYGKEHTHHEEGSDGARCMNCHMPHTTYGLLKAIRSHTVSSPTIDESVRLRRPNACNLCHLDKTLTWTKTHLEQWYGKAQVAAPDDGRAAAATWLLSGDAGQRALVAWSMGWEPAKRASGDTWLAPFLAQALDDDYAAVRFIAHRSLKRLKGYEALAYDFVMPQPQRDRARRMALAMWENRPRPRREEEQSKELYIGDDGKLNRAAVAEAVARRDRRVVDLAE